MHWFFFKCDILLGWLWADMYIRSGGPKAFAKDRREKDSSDSKKNLSLSHVLFLTIRPHPSEKRGGGRDWACPNTLQSPFGRQ